MHPILHILLYNIVPILLMVLIGFVLDKKFNLDLNTLTKINFYLFVPAFTFTYLYTANIGQDQRMAFVGAILILFAGYLIAMILGRILKFEQGIEQAFQNSLMFYNSGNIGVPLITLVYATGFYAGEGSEGILAMALTIQVMVLVVQNLFTNTLGFYNAGRGRGQSARVAFMKVLKMPTVYSIALVLILRQIPQINLTATPIWPVLQYARDGLVAIALTTLGVQLSRTSFKIADWRVLLAAIMRLVGGPLIALGIIAILGLKGITAQVLFISSAVPTAVNTALLASECKNQPEFAAQVVLVTTLACPLTLIPIIYLAPQLFPFL